MTSDDPILTPLINLVNATPDPDDSTMEIVVYKFREDPVLLGFLKVIQNTAKAKAWEITNMDLSDPKTLSLAIKLQGEVQGTKVFLETLTRWDAEIINKREKEEQERNSDG